MRRTGRTASSVPFPHGAAGRHQRPCPAPGGLHGGLRVPPPALLHSSQAAGRAHSKHRAPGNSTWDGPAGSCEHQKQATPSFQERKERKKRLSQALALTQVSLMMAETSQKRYFFFMLFSTKDNEKTGSCEKINKHEGKGSFCVQFQYKHVFQVKKTISPVPLPYNSFPLVFPYNTTT